MKLIDLLVQELPKRGGWPFGVGDIETHADGDIYFDGSPAPKEFRLPYCSDGWKTGFGVAYNNTVTKEQYESALAASQRTAWNGEGLPPEGIECEVKSGKDSWTLCKVVHSSSAGVAFIYLEEPEPYASSKYLGVLDCIGHKYANSQLRPIRTEADRKRHEVLYSLERLGIDSDITVQVFDAIAEGKIPGIRIE